MSDKVLSEDFPIAVAKRRELTKPGRGPSKRAMQMARAREFFDSNNRDMPQRHMILSLFVIVSPSQLSPGEICGMTGYPRPMVDRSMNFWISDGMVERAHRDLYQATEKAMA